MSNRQTRLPHDQILKEESYEVLMVNDDGCASVIVMSLVILSINYVPNIVHKTKKVSSGF